MVFYGLRPIAWIIIGAVFLYKISVKTGQFGHHSFFYSQFTGRSAFTNAVSGFCFRYFLRGCGRLWCPVAITAALLVGLGFKTFICSRSVLNRKYCTCGFWCDGYSNYRCGTSVWCRYDGNQQMVGRQPPFMVPIVLFWIMAIMDGWRGIKETWPAVVGASSFAIAQYLTSNFVGPELPILRLQLHPWFL